MTLDAIGFEVVYRYFKCYCGGKTARTALIIRGRLSIACLVIPQRRVLTTCK